MHLCGPESQPELIKCAQSKQKYSHVEKTCILYGEQRRLALNECSILTFVEQMYMQK